MSGVVASENRSCPFRRVKMSSPDRRELTMSNVESNWEPHDHEAVVHTHRHYHITHNFREMTGGFEHLSSAHEHEHDHAATSHSHHPHEDFDSEHAGEAHVHDHSEPVSDNGKAPAKARKAPAKKATKAAADS
jgi:hypothetical protein